MLGIQNISDIDIDRTLDPNDDMFTGDLAQYIDIGKSALKTIDTAMRMTGKNLCDISNILDFACGYGRVLRCIRAAFPNASITACDYNKRGVEFCVSTFDAKPVLSDREANNIEFSDKFDIIWVGSFFTHLPLDSFDSFLGLLVRSLNTKGLLIFTTAGRNVVGRIRNGDLGGLNPRRAEVMIDHYENFGFGWVGHDKFDWKWGRALIKPSWLLSKLEKFPLLELIYLRERYWANRQDTICLQLTNDVGNQILRNKKV